MRHFVDAIGSSMMLIAAAAPLSCIPSASTKANLQPFIAAAGAYALMAADAGPTPAPPTDGCVEGCRCNGTGKEKSGDGITIVECRCPDTCGCKKKTAPVSPPPAAAPVKKVMAAPCPNGNCPLPTRVIVR